jgi:hypothetical protein
MAQSDKKQIEFPAGQSRVTAAKRLCGNCHFEAKPRNLSSHVAESTRSLAFARDDKRVLSILQHSL